MCSCCDAGTCLYFPTCPLSIAHSLSPDRKTKTFLQLLNFSESFCVWHSLQNCCKRNLTFFHIIIFHPKKCCKGAVKWCWVYYCLVILTGVLDLGKKVFLCYQNFFFFKSATTLFDLLLLHALVWDEGNTYWHLYIVEDCILLEGKL